MLEEYFVQPSTVDRFRSSWMSAEIEAYVVWLTGTTMGCSPRKIAISS